MKNRYAGRARLSESVFRQLVREFVRGTSAARIAAQTGLNRNTVNRYFTAIRHRLADYCDERARLFPTGLGMCVFACSIAADLRTARMLSLRSTFHAEGLCLHGDDIALPADSAAEVDGWHVWVTWPDRPQAIVVRQLEADGLRTVNAFLCEAAPMLRRLHGRPNARLHLKEAEFRFNYRGRDLTQMILRLLRRHPLF